MSEYCEIHESYSELEAQESDDQAKPSDYGEEIEFELDSAQLVEMVDDLIVRDHSHRAQEMLQRAGLSKHSELTVAEANRAEAAADLFPDQRTQSSTIRNYIMPPTAEEEGEDA